MRREKKTRPESLQAKGRAQKSNAIVSQPVRLSKGEERLFYAAAIATFAFITLCEAGPLPAIAGIVTSIAALAVIETISKGVPVR